MEIDFGIERKYLAVFMISFVCIVGFESYLIGMVFVDAQPVAPRDIVFSRSTVNQLRIYNLNSDYGPPSFGPVYYEYGFGGPYAGITVEVTINEYHGCEIIGIFSYLRQITVNPNDNVYPDGPEEYLLRHEMEMIVSFTVPSGVGVGNPYILMLAITPTAFDNSQPSVMIYATITGIS